MGLFMVATDSSVFWLSGFGFWLVDSFMSCVLIPLALLFVQSMPRKTASISKPCWAFKSSPQKVKADCRPSLLLACFAGVIVDAFFGTRARATACWRNSASKRGAD